MKKLIITALVLILIYTALMICKGCSETHRPLYDDAHYQLVYVSPVTYYNYQYAYCDYFWSYYYYTHWGFYYPPHYWHGHRHGWNGWHDYYYPPNNGWNQPPYNRGWAHKPYGDRYKSRSRTGNYRTQTGTKQKQRTVKPPRITRAKASPKPQPRKKR